MGVSNQLTVEAEVSASMRSSMSDSMTSRRRPRGGFVFFAMSLAMIWKQIPCQPRKPGRERSELRRTWQRTFSTGGGWSLNRPATDLMMVARRAMSALAAAL